MSRRPQNTDHWTHVDGLLAEAQDMLDEMLANNSDEPYGLLRSVKQHIIDARGDLYADLK